MIVTGLCCWPRSVNFAPAASSCGVKDRSAPRSMPAAAGSRPNVPNSPTQTSASVSLQTVSCAYRAWVPLGSGMYIGFPGSSATLRAAGTGCQAPDWLATWMVALADGLVASSVMPRSLRERAWPRSTTRLPVHDEVHQSVPASPSIALAAGLADSEEVALACPDSAQLTVGAAGRASELRLTAPGEAAAPASPAISGSARTAGSAVAASAR